MKARNPLAALAAVVALVSSGGAAAQSDESLARLLTNPLAPIARVPVTLDWDRNVGVRREGERFSANLAPTLAIDLNRDYDLVSRTEVALVSQSDVAPGAGSQFGFGDVFQTLLLAPKLEFPGGVRYGAGAAFLLPTGTDSRLSAEKWALGPAGALVKQQDAWTFGVQGSHIWSFGGDNSRRPVSLTAVQPFAAYTTRDAWTFGLASEANFDWEGKRGTLPLSLSAAKLLRVNGQAVLVGGGVRYYLDSPETGPHGFAFRVGVTFAFP